MNRLDSVFQKRTSPALAIYTVVGYPTQDKTLSVTDAVCESGADIIELGMPFSDPVADGPVIQKAHHASLLNGTTFKEVFAAARNLRQKKSAVVLMGYINPVLAYGMEKFLNDAAQCGVDGIILPDMPPEEFERAGSLYEKNNVYPIFLVSPNSSDARIRYLDSLSKGFLYAVSSLAITGTSKQDDEKRSAYLHRLESLKLKNPVMVGFGISNKTDFDSVTKCAQGAIVGSAFINLIAGKDSSPDHIQSFVRQFR